MPNKTINAVIVEDEPKNVALLKNMLDLYCPQVHVTGDANSVETAMGVITKNNPDLVFLDIEIGGGNAFQLLDILQPVKFDVIFVTAYDNYLLQAIKYSVLDYLFKPVNIKELVAAVNKSAERIHSQKASRQIEQLLKNFSAPKNTATITLPTSFGFYVIPVQNIVRCEAKGSYTIFFMDDGKSHTASKTLKEYEEVLPPDIFFRAHHSHLINIKFIVKYHKGKGGIIEMKDKTEIPLASRRKNDFISLFDPGE
ncbi:LytR/AlgR family response regulator transcription factor [Parafilimonas sp.]|uniref:LytR/AlgR family response regulator transcription factor n=1 Tax=Parafilimonas sp. TaxID=1969739 RepID=UPI0039E25D3A